MCPDIKSIFETGSALLISDLLADEVLPTEAGIALMQQLRNSREPVFNQVLCYFYDVVCYRNADTCFASTVSPPEQDKWFISTLADAEWVVENAAMLNQLYGTQAEAEAAAVEALGLARVFFAEPVLAS